jgi:hypothetical protein
MSVGPQEIRSDDLVKGRIIADGAEGPAGNRSFDVLGASDI